MALCSIASTDWRCFIHPSFPIRIDLSVEMTCRVKEAALPDVSFKQMFSRWGSEAAGLRCGAAASSHVMQQEGRMSHGMNKSPSIHCRQSMFQTPRPMHTVKMIIPPGNDGDISHNRTLTGERTAVASSVRIAVSFHSVT